MINSSRYNFKRKLHRSCYGLADRVAQLKAHLTPSQLKQDAEFIRCQRIDTIIELGDVLGDIFQEVEQEENIHEGYGLLEGE